MNFATDRDLLLIEPTLFNDVPITAQQRISVADGNLAGVTLASAAADFTLAQIERGCVVLIADRPFEVIERLDANTLTVSLPRTSLLDDPIPASDLAGSNLTVTARTFTPQIALIHNTLLRLLGIDPNAPAPGSSPGGPSWGGCLTEDNILSLAAMARLEALGALACIYAAAAPITADPAPLLARAEAYRKRFTAARDSARILFDTNNDGVPDQHRRLAVSTLTRI